MLPQHQAHHRQVAVDVCWNWRELQELDGEADGECDGGDVVSFRAWNGEGDEEEHHDGVQGDAEVFGEGAGEEVAGEQAGDDGGEDGCEQEGAAVEHSRGCGNGMWRFVHVLTQLPVTAHLLLQPVPVPAALTARRLAPPFSSSLPSMAQTYDPRFPHQS